MRLSHYILIISVRYMIYMKVANLKDFKFNIKIVYTSIVIYANNGSEKTKVKLYKSHF